MARPPAFVFGVLGLLVAGLAASPVTDVLTPSGGLPAHLVSTFVEPAAFAQSDNGDYVVLDRRAQHVYVVDAGRTSARSIVSIGAEPGHILRPRGFAMASHDIFAVADDPGVLQRLQYFGTDGQPIGGFYLNTSQISRFTLGPLVLNGLASLQFNGRTFLVSAPESGSLISELDLNGNTIARIGVPRPTGYERDRDLHLMLNVGLPLFDPAGGYYYVFQTGRPMLRKYDANGTLVYERHIEGTELDAEIQALPTVWPSRPPGLRPLVPPLIRTASVDPSGHLWITLMQPFTFVYDAAGEKVRTVQFQATGPLAVTSLSFAGPGRVLVTPGCYEFAIR